MYERIGRSVAAYERSPEVNPFSSKFDLFWDNAKAAGKDVTKIRCGMGGMGGGGMGGGMGCPGGGRNPNRWTAFRNLGLTDAELQGLAVFNDRAGCSSCHSLKPGSAGYPLFTDFGYDNIGVPKNPDNPFYKMPAAWNPDGEDWVDYGLGDYLKSAGYRRRSTSRRWGNTKYLPCATWTCVLPKTSSRHTDTTVTSSRWTNRLLLPLARYDGRRLHGRRRNGRWGYGRRWHGRWAWNDHVPAARSGPEPVYVEHVPQDADRQHRGVPEDALGWILCEK